MIVLFIIFTCHAFSLKHTVCECQGWDTERGDADISMKNQMTLTVLRSICGPYWQPRVRQPNLLHFRSFENRTNEIFSSSFFYSAQMVLSSIFYCDPSCVALKTLVGHGIPISPPGTFHGILSIICLHISFSHIPLDRNSNGCCMSPNRMKIESIQEYCFPNTSFWTFLWLKPIVEVIL